MPISPILRAQTTYPFVRLNEAAAARRQAGLEVIDFGMGDPREPTDARIIEALRDGVRKRMGYPAAVGVIWNVASRLALRPEVTLSGNSGDSSISNILGTGTGSNAEGFQVGVFETSTDDQRRCRLRLMRGEHDD